MVQSRLAVFFSLKKVFVCQIIVVNSFRISHSLSPFATKMQPRHGHQIQTSLILFHNEQRKLTIIIIIMDTPLTGYCAQAKDQGEELRKVRPLPWG